MAVMLMAKAFKIKVGNAGKKLVLIKLADNANDHGECWPSYQHVADQCEMCKRSAVYHINSLIDDGLIHRSYRKGPKGNSTNIYVLTLDGAKSAPLDNTGLDPSAESAPPPSAESAPPSATAAPPSAESAPPPSAESAPRISHSFESVIEPSKRPREIAAPQQELTPPPEKKQKLVARAKPRFDPTEIIPDGVNAEAWCRWCDWRKSEKKKAITPQSATMQLNKLKLLTPEQQAMTIDHSIENQYQGLFPEKFTNVSSFQTQREKQQELSDKRWDYEYMTTF
jgi:hypothetical protein